MIDQQLEALLLRPRRHYWLDGLIVVGLVAGISFILLWQTMFVMIPAGSVGVLYRLFGNGTDKSHRYDEGLAFKWPWDIITLYEVRTQSQSFHVDALSVNGLEVGLDLTVIYRPEPNLIGELHSAVGPDYYRRKIEPNVIEAARSVVGQEDPHALYTLSALEVGQRILTLSQQDLDDPALIIRDVAVRKVVLPPELSASITQKLTQEQVAQTYEFRLRAEQQEAERKRIEAIGIENFYSVVSSALNPALLTWRGIEATVEIARSPNSKVVILGGSKDQLPLILGSDIATVPPGPPLLPKAPDERPVLPDFNRLPPLFPDVGTSSKDAEGRPAQPGDAP